MNVPVKTSFTGNRQSPVIFPQFPDGTNGGFCKLSAILLDQRTLQYIGITALQHADREKICGLPQDESQQIKILYMAAEGVEPIIIGTLQPSKYKEAGEITGNSPFFVQRIALSDDLPEDVLSAAKIEGPLSFLEDQVGHNATLPDGTIIGTILDEQKYMPIGQTALIYPLVPVRLHQQEKAAPDDKTEPRCGEMVFDRKGGAAGIIVSKDTRPKDTFYYFVPIEDVLAYHGLSFTAQRLTLGRAPSPGSL